MDNLLMRPRTSTELVDTAFQVFRAHLGAFVVCSAIANAPLLLLHLLFLGDPTRVEVAQVSDYLGRGGLLLLASVLTYALMTAVLIVCTSQAYLGEEVDVARAVRRLASRLAPVLVTSLLASILIVFGLMFLLLPAVYLAARYFCVAQAVMLEEAGVTAAFARSSALSRGHKRHILGTLGLAFIIYFVLYLGVGLVSSLAGFVVQTVVSTVAGAFIYPILAITHTLLYYDVRIRNEGLDIELMAGALTPLPASL